MANLNNVDATCVAVNGATIVLPDVAAKLQHERAASLKAYAHMDDPEWQFLSDHTNGKVLRVGTSQGGGDHPVLLCAREFMYSALHGSLFHTTQLQMGDGKPKTVFRLKTPVKTLVIGATLTDIQRYWYEPNIHFWVAYLDVKDAQRCADIITAANIGSIDEPSVLRDGFKPYNKSFPQGSLEWFRYHRIHVGDFPYRNEYRQLLAPDCLYNITREDLARMMDAVGAVTTHAITFLPPHLLFEEMTDLLPFKVRRLQGPPAKVTGMTEAGAVALAELDKAMNWLHKITDGATIYVKNNVVTLGESHATLEGEDTEVQEALLEVNRCRKKLALFGEVERALELDEEIRLAREVRHKKYKEDNPLPKKKGYTQVTLAGHNTGKTRALKDDPEWLYERDRKLAKERRREELRKLDEIDAEERRKKSPILKSPEVKLVAWAAKLKTKMKDGFITFAEYVREKLCGARTTTYLQVHWHRRSGSFMHGYEHRADIWAGWLEPGWGVELIDRTVNFVNEIQTQSCYMAYHVITATSQGGRLTSRYSIHESDIGVKVLNLHASLAIWNGHIRKHLVYDIVPKIAVDKMLSWLTTQPPEFFEGEVMMMLAKLCMWSRRQFLQLSYTNAIEVTTNPVLKDEQIEVTALACLMKIMQDHETTHKAVKKMLGGSPLATRFRDWFMGKFDDTFVERFVLWLKTKRWDRKFVLPLESVFYFNVELQPTAYVFKRHFIPLREDQPVMPHEKLFSEVKPLDIKLAEPVDPFAADCLIC